MGMTIWQVGGVVNVGRMDLWYDLFIATRCWIRILGNIVTHEVELAFSILECNIKQGKVPKLRYSVLFISSSTQIGN